MMSFLLTRGYQCLLEAGHGHGHMFHEAEEDITTMTIKESIPLDKSTKEVMRPEWDIKDKINTDAAMEAVRAMSRGS